MRMLLRLLLLVAGFAYGAMPLHGIAAVAMPAPATSEAHPGKAAATEASAHGHHSADITCPHGMVPADMDHSGDNSSHKTVAGGHCSSCLTLPPMIVFADAGLAVRTADAPGLSPHPDSAPTGPLERPPRIRG